VAWRAGVLTFAIAACLGSVAGAIAARQESALPKPSAVVKPSAYVSLEPVPRGSDFEVAVVIEIARGFHVNSHTPRDPYLIPTTIKAQPTAGLEISGTKYPKGRDEKFAFSPDKPLDVYTGSVTILLHVASRASAHLGANRLPLTLRYQACNDSACLAPVNVPVNVKFDLAPAGTKGRAVHSEIFASASASH